MTRKLKTSVADMVAAARSRIKELSAVETIALLDDPDTVIVDLRDIRERQREGAIPGAFHCPRGMLEFWIDPDSPYYKDIFDHDAKFVLHCAAGWRSALAADTMQSMGFDKVAHIDGGFKAWRDADGPIEPLAKGPA
ncbi:rhodanese-like domain-containing protein [Halovulum sp. GXIMD14793]